MGNKEREAFEKLQNPKFFQRAVYLENSNAYVVNDEYRDDLFSLEWVQEINYGWLMWQAAKATPEGFVLVPSGVLDLTRFMCETWTEIDKFVYKNCQNLELYPIIQGSKTQSAIRKIGKQKFNPFAVGAGIQAMIEAQEQSHD